MVGPWRQFQKGGRTVGASYRRHGQQAVSDREGRSCAAILVISGLSCALTDVYGLIQAKGAAVPSVAASMITSLREQPSGEDELTSKAVPATMYIGKYLRVYFLIRWSNMMSIRWRRYC